MEIQALNPDGSYRNFLSVSGKLVGPDLHQTSIDLVQSGPGNYAADFNAPSPGDYVALVNYRGSRGDAGVMVGGVSVTASHELRDLQSNDATLHQIAARTGGRVLAAFDPTAGLFSRDGLRPSTSAGPLWSILLPMALATLLMDVAVRRIAWDRDTIRSVIGAMTMYLQSHAIARPAAPGSSAVALRRAKHAAAVQRQSPSLASPIADRPNPKAKFTAKGVDGDISHVLAGAAPAPPPQTAKPAQGVADRGDVLDQLRRAKNRAREQTDKTER